MNGWMLVAPAVAPALSGWRATTIARGCALLIGGIGGLIGLGGGGFRLPKLVTLIGIPAHWLGSAPSLRPWSRLGRAATRLHGSPHGSCRASRITDLSARLPIC